MTALCSYSFPDDETTRAGPPLSKEQASAELRSRQAQTVLVGTGNENLDRHSAPGLTTFKSASCSVGDRLKSLRYPHPRIRSSDGASVLDASGIGAGSRSPVTVRISTRATSSPDVGVQKRPSVATEPRSILRRS